ncbi:MAG TPA: hypothetical protein DF774_02350 [Rheinheimera sp.]|uniref:AAA family ATPase n=1 Tax=Rheinheimera sp. TaxID=1869214 RepID=UPI000EBC326C|nr:AAA family ATPase [Rheinheimera sp.]HCU64582.1 hypothetical protein [Rheinheimera sp.]
MNITHLTVKNFQGLANLDTAVNAPILFVAGGNGAGKSSLRDAIRIALTGAPSRVSLKKDYDAMIKDGTKKSSVTVATDVGNFDFTLPAGKGLHSDLSFLPLCIDATAFTTMKADERRKLLFELTGATASAKRVETDLTKLGAQPGHIQLILPLLKAGFAAAEKSARERATEAKGAWRAITGETWGSNKGDTWEPTVAEQPVDEAAISACSEKVQSNNAALNQLNQQRGTLMAQLNSANTQAQQRATLQETAGKLERARQKNVVDQKSLQEVQAQIELAEQAASIPQTLACPCCEAVLFLTPEGVLADAGHFDMSAPDVDTSKLEQFRQSEAMLQRAIANNERDIVLAENATNQLASFTELNTANIQEELEAIDADLLRLNDVRQQLQADLNNLHTAKQAYENSMSAKPKADAHHAEITSWLVIAEALSPSGIPANILAQAMGPFNVLLQNINSLVPEWRPVQLTEDMEILAASRPFGLLSESEQWRVQTMLTLALAQLSGINLVVLDRVDVLEPAARIELVNLLCDLTDQNLNLQIIMLGTLAKAPSGMPETVQCIWLAGGESVSVQQGKAA